MVLDAEAAADDLGDPVGAPEVVVPAVGHGPLQQQVFQLLDLDFPTNGGRWVNGLSGSFVLGR